MLRNKNNFKLERGYTFEGEENFYEGLAVVLFFIAKDQESWEETQRMSWHQTRMFLITAHVQPAF